MGLTLKETILKGEELRSYLKNYYGRVLRKTEDLEKKACCADNTAARFPEIVKLLPQEVRERNFGCGCSIPDDDLAGLTVLDLGAGAGLDAFIMAKLVGPEGRVHGIDMTEEQLEVARRNVAPAMAAFGHSRPNVFFHQGYIETAEAIADEAVDLVISDCTINLSPLKAQVVDTIYRVLKNGGEMYISDISADRRVPEKIRQQRQLVAECLGGALYEHDWYDLLKDCGFGDPRVVSRRLVEEDVLGVPIRFYSITLRAFKFAEPLDRRCEDFGQAATYLGTIPSCPARFALDDHHVFETHRPAAVCRNTARMLSETRLGRHFEVTRPIQHFGLFPCAPAGAAAISKNSAQGGQTGGRCC
ncbi:MAG: methyltransferase domain-containing protein [Planctomycetes bacterium]|nr:methyltransferase domain-containing protein [Planctomycetota bacterium]